ncbi:WxL domain-containing protein [Enterococcus pallens]|uniref:WxL domain-containing protein n=1 Tax=Enterococcus pallens ATCC BAA-351 TaxID=1158607 RepID=R2SNS9_9ENTE|nr:WxL domain-containing protein [Enterococcus pallens]EOH94486.1 hypothetical protein UAU_02221 [Enterococcus pallens ATCC BAA-351]EOU24365.1 hypothetical protein I588_00352 [Enterococcus pallens ATCC BAA-351]OJG76907.1 hypothetical protein RV10_GL003154 [Enterococcus pallens]
MKDLKGKVLVGLASVSMLGGIALGSVQGFAALTGDTDAQVRFNPYSGGGEDTGNLALAYVPAGIDFGTQNVDAGNAVSYAGNTGGANYLAVDDDRTTPGQWKLVAAATVLSSTTTAQTISSGDITLTSTAAVRDYDVSVGTPDVSGAVGNPIAGVTVTRPASSVLTLGGGTADIASTATSANQGLAIPIDSVQMNITSQNAHGGQTFTGKINWTLSDTI